MRTPPAHYWQKSYATLRLRILQGACLSKAMPPLSFYQDSICQKLYRNLQVPCQDTATHPLGFYNGSASYVAPRAFTKMLSVNADSWCVPDGDRVWLNKATRGARASPCQCCVLLPTARPQAEHHIGMGSRARPSSLSTLCSATPCHHQESARSRRL